MSVREVSAFLITFFSRVLHSLSGVEFCCRFTPSCGEYGRSAIRRHGVLRGGRLTLARLLRCRPGGAWGF